LSSLYVERPVAGEMGSKSVDSTLRICWRVCCDEREGEDEVVMGLKAPGTRWPVLDEADGCIMRVVSDGHGLEGRDSGVVLGHYETVFDISIVEYSRC
jgi:hypothetical protein